MRGLPQIILVVNQTLETRNENRLKKIRLRIRKKKLGEPKRNNINQPNNENENQRKINKRNKTKHSEERRSKTNKHARQYQEIQLHIAKKRI